MSSHQPLPLDTPSDQAQAREYSKRMQVALIKICFWKTCVNCEHWSKPVRLTDKEYTQDPSIPPLCKKWNSLPPPEVVVIGCSEWLSVVPF